MNARAILDHYLSLSMLVILLLWLFCMAGSKIMALALMNLLIGVTDLSSKLMWQRPKKCLLISEH